MRVIILSIITSLVITGCVSSSEMGSIVPKNISTVKPDSSLFQSMSVETYGQEYSNFYNQQISNTNISTALERALGEAGYLSADNTKYTIWPSLVHLKQPAIGLNMEVTAQVNYIIKDEAGNIVLDETINSSYTAEMSEAFIGVTRVRLANEGAVRNNISAFMDRLADWEKVTLQ